MDADPRPLVLVDVDGVLNVLASAKRRRPLAYHEGWVQRRVDVGGLTFRLFVNPRTGGWLRKLADEAGAELAWGSTWEEYANPCVGPLVHLPALRWAPVRDGKHKADGIVPWTQGRPFVWFDDEPDAAEVTARVAGDQPHLVVPVDESAGLTEDHVAVAREWLLSLPVSRLRESPPLAMPYPGYVYDGHMGRTLTPDGKRRTVSCKLSDAKYAAVEAARIADGKPRALWLESLIDAALEASAVPALTAVPESPQIAPEPPPEPEAPSPAPVREKRPRARKGSGGAGSAAAVEEAAASPRAQDASSDEKLRKARAAAEAAGAPLVAASDLKPPAPLPDHDARLAVFQPEGAAPVVHSTPSIPEPQVKPSECIRRVPKGAYCSTCGKVHK